MRATISFMFFSLVLHGSGSAQVPAQVILDRQAGVFGVNMKSATLKRDPKSRKITGIQVEVMTNDKIPSFLEYFECRVRFYDKGGHQIADTVFRHYAPGGKPVSATQMVIIEETGDTLIAGNPDYDPEVEERKYNERKARKLFTGFIGYWPPRAIRAKVGLHLANYGMTTYFAMQDPKEESQGARAPLFPCSRSKTVARTGAGAPVHRYSIEAAQVSSGPYVQGPVKPSSHSAAHAFLHLGRNLPVRSTYFL